MRALDLGGAWRLASRPASGAPLPCPVPGMVLDALVRAGAAPDPRRGGGPPPGDPARATWTLSRAFDADAALLREARAELATGWLPAGAELLLNGRPAFRAAPAAGPRRADVRRLLKRGRNELLAVFPPERPAAAAPLPGEPPRAPAAGLPRGLSLRAWSGARIADLGFGQRHAASGPVDLLAGGWVETAPGGAAAGLRLDLRVLDPDGAPVASAAAAFPAGGGGSFHAALRVPRPRLWWPAGLGPQPLYAVEATLRGADGAVLDAASARVGLRTLAPVARDGGAAALACNGRAFFLRGAVWRRPNPVSPPLSREDFEPLLASAADAHFNALRLAPGEPPPPDAFWDLCDELGLVVLGAAAAAEAALGPDADGGGEDAPPPPFLRHACVPDAPLGEPDEDSGLSILRTPVSLPAPEALAAELPRAERVPNGPAMARRTALRGGPATLVSALAAEWPVPARAEDWAWLSQLAAARAMRRRIADARTAPGATGLLWDPFASAWAAADASSIDRDGRWKALQYEAARAFAPEALFAPPPDADPRAPARFVNAAPRRRRGSLAWRLTAMDGTTAAQGVRPFAAAAFSTAEFPLPDPTPFFARWDRGSLVLWIAALDEEGYVLSRDHRLYAPPRELRLQDPGLAVDVAPPQRVDGEQVYRVTLSVSAPAFGIFLDLPGRPALFGDGFFALEPDETLEVEVTPLAPVREAAFRKALRVRSLWDLVFG